MRAIVAAFKKPPGPNMSGPQGASAWMVKNEVFFD
jgi:hypothetical protein